MYRRILVATDGSRRSLEAVKAGVNFARSVGAQVFGFYVLSVLQPDYLDSLMHQDPRFLDKQRDMFERLGDEHLAYVQATADAAQVPCSCRKIPASMPSAMIAMEAQRLLCDLVYMASHRWNGEAARLLGSVTLQVLSSSPIPVLVHRANVPIGEHGAANE